MAKLSGIKGGGKTNWNKAQLAQMLASETDLSIKKSNELITAFTNIVKEVVMNSNGYITLAGFGTFKKAKRKGYTVKRTKEQAKIFGEKSRVQPKEYLQFTASK